MNLPGWALVVVMGALVACGEDTAEVLSPEASGGAGGGGGSNAAGTGGKPGGAGGSASGGASGSGGVAPGPGPGEGFKPAVNASGWGDTGVKGVPNPGGKCTKNGGTPMKLPGTGVEYCLKASDACLQAGASCPLYVSLNLDGAFFPYLDDAANGPAISAELYCEMDGDLIKDKMAELPRVIAADFPGLDRERIYAIGWSAGAGGVGRSLCHVSKKSDFSPYGTTSDLYAAVIGLGGCGCTNDYVQLAGSWHVATWNGAVDQFNGGDACEAGLRKRAAVNGCSALDAAWKPVAPDDPYAKNGDGSANAERLDFGTCQFGGVTGYRFKDEGHVLSAKKYFDPKISGVDTVWRFLQGRTKSNGGNP